MSVHRRRFWLVALLMSSAAAGAHTVQWPELAGRAGPYSGIRTAEDAKSAASAGFNITVQSAYDPAVLKIMSELGIRYIDIRLWSLVHAQCKRQFDARAAAGRERRCEISDDMRDSVLRDAQAHLQEVKSNPSVLGYWILDDYPAGNVSALLVELHRLVEQSDLEARTHKPTICGIGGSLDHRSSKDPRIVADRAYIDAALDNLSPTACDIVAPYFYGAAVRNDPTWIDWSMNDLMPWFMQRLRARGFANPSLLPVVQAFYAGKRGGSTYYVQPRAQDIEAQARGYCRFGALSMMFFTWQADDAERSYVNDSDIRRGVSAAVAVCRHLQPAR